MVNVLKFCTPKFLTNSAVPDQTAPSRVYTACHFPLGILRNLHEKQWNKLFKILEHLPYILQLARFILTFDIMTKFVVTTIGMERFLSSKSIHNKYSGILYLIIQETYVVDIC